MPRVYKGTYQGRKLNLTPAVQKKILEAMEIGVPECYAHALAGINATTLHNWRQTAADDTRQDENALSIREHFDLVRQAEAKCVHSAISAIWQSNGKDFLKYAWILDRRFAENFAQLKRVDQTTQIEHSMKDKIRDAVKQVEMRVKPPPALEDKRSQGDTPIDVEFCVPDDGNDGPPEDEND